MYRDRGGGSSKGGGDLVDRKRINDALDKQLEKSSARNKAIAVPSTSAGKHVEQRDTRSTLNTSKNKASEGIKTVPFPFYIWCFCC